MREDLFTKKRHELDRLVQDWFATSGVLITGESIVPHITGAAKVAYAIRVAKCSQVEAAYIRLQSLRPEDDMDATLALPLRLIRLPVSDYSEIYQTATLGILLRTGVSEYPSYGMTKKREIEALTRFVTQVRKELGENIPVIGHKEKQTVYATALRENFRRMATCFCSCEFKPDLKGFETEFPTVRSLTLASRTEVQECLSRHRHNLAISDWDKEAVEALGCFDRLFSKAGLCFKSSS